MVIAELFLLDAKGKWGMNPNSARRNSTKSSEMRVWWGKLIKRKS
jgi:hypothetical protein